MYDLIRITINDGITTTATLNIKTLDLFDALTHEVKKWAREYGFKYNHSDIGIMLNSLRKYNITALVNEFACLTIEIME